MLASLAWWCTSPAPSPPLICWILKRRGNQKGKLKEEVWRNLSSPLLSSPLLHTSFLPNPGAEELWWREPLPNLLSVAIAVLAHVPPRVRTAECCPLPRNCHPWLTKSLMRHPLALQKHYETSGGPLCITSSFRCKNQKSRLTALRRPSRGFRMPLEGTTCSLPGPQEGSRG